MEDRSQVRSGANDFHAAIEDAHVVALWEMFGGAGGPQPQPEPAITA